MCVEFYSIGQDKGGHTFSRSLDVCFAIEGPDVNQLETAKCTQLPLYVLM